MSVISYAKHKERTFFSFQSIFRDIKRAFKESLAHKLDKLGVTNDGGPQHGYVLDFRRFVYYCLLIVNRLFWVVRDYAGARLAWVRARACARVERKDPKDVLNFPLRSFVK